MSRQVYLSSPFWLKKIRNAFGVYDADKSGTISIEDSILVAERFAKKCPQKAEEIKKAMTDLWNTASGSCDKKLDINEWIETRITFSLRPDAKDVFRANANAKFDMIDVDNSGLISVKEFQDYFECMGIDVKFAPIAFKAIDTTGDGTISREEFVNSAVEYAFNTEDEEHPSKYFYGPLAEN